MKKSTKKALKITGALAVTAAAGYLPCRRVFAVHARWIHSELVEPPREPETPRAGRSTGRRPVTGITTWGLPFITEPVPWWGGRVVSQTGPIPP